MSDTYRKLVVGDVLQVGDEFLHPNYQTWEPVFYPGTQLDEDLLRLDYRRPTALDEPPERVRE